MNKLIKNFILSVAVAAPLGVMAQNSQAQDVCANPYLPLWEHLPDGEPRCFEDPDNPGKYRIYIIGSHDVRFGSYCGPDVHAWSAPAENLNDWRDEGSIFTYPIDNQWDVMYAPDLVEVNRKDGKREYYLYPHARGHRRLGFVAKSDRPMGPFKVINATEDGRAAKDGSIFGFDPSVFVENITDPNDPDYNIGFRAYGFYGFQHVDAAQLDQNTMWSKRQGTDIINGFIPASLRYGELKPSEGTNFPYVFPGEDLGRFNFFEAASIRKVGNKYVWVYSGYSGPDYGLGSTNSALRYAYGDTPLGPWKSGGVLVDSRAVVPNKDGSKLMTAYSGHNTHGSIEKVGDQWYCFYHRAPRGFGNARQAMVAPVKIEWDEKSVKDGGAVRIRAYDPYAENNIWTCTASNGDDYKGAEVTSEGFNMFGLDPYKYYSAGFACYLSDYGVQSDSWDVWNNHAAITGVKNGNIIGYKYFGFGGLDKDTKGIKAFEGTKPGNGTMLNLFITPKSAAGCKVQVWMDGPYDNATWKGKKLGVITIPAKAKNEVTRFTLDVSSMVDNLDKKHAIYLVAEGADGQQLFDLEGLGFSSKTKKIDCPVVPQVKILVNGTQISVPDTPVRSTEQNGLVDQSHYCTTVALPKGSAAPVVKVVAPGVDTKVDMQKDKALIECTYKGKTKYYEVILKN